VFYFGHFGALSFVKNIAIKINKLLTEIYIAIFFLAGTRSGNQLLKIQSAQNKASCLQAVSGWFVLSAWCSRFKLALAALAVGVWWLVLFLASFGMCRWFVGLARVSANRRNGCSWFWLLLLLSIKSAGL